VIVIGVVLPAAVPAHGQAQRNEMKRMKWNAMK
jgi:hypothetical protein